MDHRIQALRRRFKTLGIANYLVTRPSNIRWLCRFSGSNGLLMVTGRHAHFITHGRYKNQSGEQVTSAEIHVYSSGKSIADAFVKEMKLNKLIRFRGRIGIENSFMNVEMYELLKRTFPNSGLIETLNVIEDLAQVKEEYEIEAIKRAVKITDKVFKSVLDEVKPGVRELDIAAEISYQHMKNGAQKNSFETIVASGPRSALPHGIASNRKIRKGDFVTFDMGCLVDGYASDMTRTIVVGEATKKQKNIYSIVLQAQQSAVDAIKPGIKCSELDDIARKIISDAGYGDNFPHSLGHGLGLEVHARPVLAKQSQAKLKPGMVVTVEPGIYINGWGGVRIEDDVLVTGEGHQVLNKSTKELLEL